MIPVAFGYEAPTGLADVVALLAADPDGTVLLAGGSWVVPSLGRGERTARRVVDLRWAGLAGIQVSDGRVRLGSCATYADIIRSAQLAVAAPVLRLMATGITGGPQIIGRCTVGGSAVAARPGSDVPAALTVLDAVAEIAGPAGTRRIPVRDLWVDAFTVSLLPSEVLVAFEFDAMSPSTRCGYVKLKHSTSSWPIVTAAASVETDPDGVVRQASLAIGAACRTPFTVAINDIMVGRHANEETVRAAGDAATAAVTNAWHDELAPDWYRTAAVAVAARRALTDAVATTPSAARLEQS